MKKITIGFIGVILGFVGGAGTMTFGGTATEDDAIADKNAILKQYVYAQVRLNEVPTLDLTTASTDEMSKAYSELVNEKQTPKGDPDLFKDLHTQAMKEGTACK